MARKRLPALPKSFKNLLVSPGTPGNPITIGEKAKAILIQLKLYEDDGRGGKFRDENYGDGSYRQAQERLEFLKLIEFKPKYSDVEWSSEHSRRIGEIKRLRDDLAQLAIVNGSYNEMHGVLQQIYTKESNVDNNPFGPWLTDAGKALLLSGNVTVTL